VGHTLGIAHNFAASTTGDASVMDYPNPKAELIDGKIDLSNPYGVGIGDWDKVAVAYGYQDFPKGTNEDKALNKIIENAYASGLKYISDSDARPQSGAHPYAHLWDSGSEPAAQLAKIMEIRKVALQNFGEANIRKGEAMAKLEEALVPMYFFHRFQIEATVKTIGGLDYSYNLKGDKLPGPKIVAKSAQQKALNELLKTLDPKALAIPENILELIPPRPPALGYSRELFRGNTGPALDALSIAETAADMTVSLILNPARANRLVEYAARENNLSLETVLNRLVEASWERKSQNGYTSSVQQVVNHVVLNNMIKLAASKNANPLTKAITHKKLTDLRSKLSKKGDADSKYAVYTIDQYLANPDEFEAADAPAPPPGSPIGSGTLLYCDF
jgi:hypothetical protein